MISPDITLTFLGLFGIFYCWEKAIHAKQIIIVDERRMDLYRLRDRLHELVLSGELSDTSRDYKLTARFLHAIIKIQGEADFLLFCELVIGIVRSTKRKSFHKIHNPEVLKIVGDATVILLQAIYSNSLLIRTLDRCCPKKLGDEEAGISWHKPMQTYNELNRLKRAVPVPAV